MSLTNTSSRVTRELIILSTLQILHTTPLQTRDLPYQQMTTTTSMTTYSDIRKETNMDKQTDKSNTIQTHDSPNASPSPIPYTFIIHKHNYTTPIPTSSKTKPLTMVTTTTSSSPTNMEITLAS